jgi:hypothetical protein
MQTLSPEAYADPAKAVAPLRRATALQKRAAPLHAHELEIGAFCGSWQVY